MADPIRRATYQMPLALGLVGVAVGAAIGAGTGMWWMMGVLGGVFAGLATVVRRGGR